MKASLALLALVASASALRISNVSSGSNTQKRYQQHESAVGGSSQLRTSDPPSYATRYQDVSNFWRERDSSDPSNYVPTFGAGERYAQRQARRYAPPDEISYGGYADTTMNAGSGGTSAFPSAQGSPEASGYAPKFAASDRYAQRQAEKYAPSNAIPYREHPDEIMDSRRGYGSTFSSGSGGPKQVQINNPYLSSSDSSDDELQAYQSQPLHSSPPRQYGGPSRAPTRPYRTRLTY